MNGVDPKSENTSIEMKSERIREEWKVNNGNFRIFSPIHQN